MSLRVLMTVDAVGGVWRYAMDLGAALAATGHRVAFAGQGPEPSPAQRAEAEATGELAWCDIPLDWMAERPDAIAGAGPWIDGLARRLGADVLHLNSPTLAAELAPGGPPVLAVTHSCLATWFAVVDRAPIPEPLCWQADLTAAGLRRADAILAPSRAHAAATEAAYGLSGIAVVPNGSRAPLLPPGGGSGAVALGRWWDKGKNGAVLDAAAEHAACAVTLIGATEAPDGQRLEARHATLAGPLPYEQAMARVAEAAIFVSPSIYEPFGLAALEAARAGRPLLLSDIPVYRELWDGVARFFDPASPAALARALDALAGAPGEREALGAAAQARAERLGTEQQATAMAALYQRLAAMQGVI
ncbi:glycosyltransferase family 4 protein [Pseudoroseicyclus tamaricis]|uniref:Glycosyltransferase n=1 Tax=Pseudoroseicyclus tamaricis TaxID=2705421 RepID=A0A6B2JWP9_9RHOB|nr:glycosyltransferase family 4 protein [Pseudoroseicyclus tamaricis]NDU99791.1 glycosyltransferase [Pseudoroseicyclus tamaricis]